MDFNNLNKVKQESTPVAVPAPVKKERKKPTRLGDKKGLSRQKAIENCEECNGKPETTEFTVQNFCGTRCNKDHCMLIVSYERVRT